MSENAPLEDPVEEGRRVVEAADDAGLTVRQIGGTAIWEHAETVREGPFERDYRDVDFVATTAEEGDVVDLMVDELGYEANKRFNTMRRFRLEFFDEENDRKADYILDRFEFCHQWSLKDRLDVDYPTVPIEDLLMSKIQIVEASDRDVRDIVAMVNDHPVQARDDTEVIDPRYIADLCKDDWGLYRTTTDSIDRVEEYLQTNDLPVDETELSDRLESIRNKIESEPKTLRWKLRSVIGEHKQWYDQPELT
ncbi:MAG: hypothetical protein ABEI96_02255 [Haloarculaceae archaeon]